MAEPKRDEPPAVRTPEPAAAPQDAGLERRVAVCEAALRQMNPGHFAGDRATAPAPQGLSLERRVAEVEKALELMAPGNLRLARERLAQGK